MMKMPKDFSNAHRAKIARQLVDLVFNTYNLFTLFFVLSLLSLT